MTKHPLRLDDYLKHIAQAIEGIESYQSDHVLPFRLKDRADLR
jgi:hypothetical protein